MNEEPSETLPSAEPTAHALTIPGSGAQAILVVPASLPDGEPAARHPAFLCIHGWDGGKEDHLADAKALAAMGVLALVFDLSGHGETRHLNRVVTRDTGMQDVTAAYDLLAGHAMTRPDAIGVLGSSYGAYLATLLTRRRPVEWLALRVPAQYRDDDWHEPKVELKSDQDLEHYRREPTPPSCNASLSACSDFKGDVLIVASEHDDTVPPQDIRDYEHACKHARTLGSEVIAGADHALSDDGRRDAFTRLFSRWVSRVVPGTRSSVAPTGT